MLTIFQMLKEQFEKKYQEFTIIDPMIYFYINHFTCPIKIIEIVAFIAELVQVRAKELKLEVLDS